MRDRPVVTHSMSNHILRRRFAILGPRGDCYRLPNPDPGIASTQAPTERTNRGSSWGAW